MQYIIQNNKNHWNHIPKTPLAWKKLPKKGHFSHIGNEIKICSQNKWHHHLSNVCENSFRMFHSKWVISDYHSFVWQFEFPWLNLTNCPNKWMVIRNDPLTVKHAKWIFTDVGKVMMAFILATDFDFMAYMSKMAFFGSFFSRQWRFWNMILLAEPLNDEGGEETGVPEEHPWRRASENATYYSPKTHAPSETRTRAVALVAG